MKDFKKCDLIEKILEPYIKDGFAVECSVPSEKDIRSFCGKYFVKSCTVYFCGEEDENSTLAELEARDDKMITHYEKGCFDATQVEVDDEAFNALESAVELTRNRGDKDRFYIMRSADKAAVYWYGRDIEGKDILWAYKTVASEIEKTDFYDAFEYLRNHPYFEDEFEQSLYIEVVKVNPATHSVDDDREKNTLTQVWLECGSIYKDYIKENCSRYSHDIYLDCGGDTFEDAIIMLAALVKIYRS